MYRCWKKGLLPNDRKTRENQDRKSQMIEEAVLCSDCFGDQGLRLDFTEDWHSRGVCVPQLRLQNW
jgi:hypothetical protein